MNTVHYMQIQKENTRELILKSAEKFFQKKGFMATSMREIATDSNIGLGNIYNYFKNKDEIFKAIVQASVTRFIQVYDKGHKQESVDIMQITSKSYFENVVNEYVSLITTNRSHYRLLFFKSQGSSFERFKDEFTDYAAKQSKQYFIEIRSIYPHLNVNISDFFIELSISAMFNLFEKLLMLKIKSKDIKPIIAEYMKFHIAGYRELIRI